MRWRKIDGTRALVVTGFVSAIVFGVAPACHLVTGVDRFETDPKLDIVPKPVTPCITDADCSAGNNECRIQLCVGGQCDVTIIASGTPVKEQVVGDCKRNECDGMGNRVNGVADTSDILNDGKECTVDMCSPTDGPTNTPSAAGTGCAMGTMFCDGKGACVECALNENCAMGLVCSMNHCVPAVCVNQMQDTGETDVDCGGMVCSPCGTGLKCVGNSDCASQFCKMGQCAEPSCTDGVKNGDETDADCGGGCPMDCADGKGCNTELDCISMVCTTNLCQVPSCTDGTQNGTEVDTDCGGPCPACTVGKKCIANAGCTSKFCLKTEKVCTEIIQVAAGTRHACAVVASDAALSNGQIYCWGSNKSSELGFSPPMDPVREPQEPVVNLTNVTSISTFTNAGAMNEPGSHTCARSQLANGTSQFHCWGRNENGQLGDGSMSNSLMPKPITLANGEVPKQVIAGGRHTCAITNTEHVQCWGANGQGQLGVNQANLNNSLTPIAVLGPNVPNPMKAIQVVLGNVHSCALLSDKTVYCWGNNERGQVGIGSTATQILYPRKLNLAGTTLLTSGQDFVCARTPTTLFCWGDNTQGQLGSKPAKNTSPISLSDTISPVDPFPLSLGGAGSVGTTPISGGHSCFVIAGGKLVCLGLNDYGQLGIGNTTSTSMPTAVLNIGEVKQISLGTQFSCAILKDGTLHCWGRNDFGQTGTGMMGTNVPDPQPVKWPDP